MQSLRDTQIEHGERLMRLESALGNLGSEVRNLRSEVAAGFAAVGGRLELIVELLRSDND